MGSKERSGDRRIRKSERILKDAYKRLLEIRDPSEITVKDLCETADVNRSTFYARFGYLEALESVLIRDHVEQICSIGTDSERVTYTETGVLPAEVVRQYLENFRKDKFINRLLTCVHPEKFHKMILLAHVAFTVPESSSLESRYAAYLQNGGVIVTVSKWIHDGCIMPVEHLTEIIQDASRGMIKHMGIPLS